MIPRWRFPGHLLLIGAALVFFLFPVYWMVNTAFKPPSEWLTDPPIFFPHPIVLRNFVDALNHWNGWKGLKDSLLVSVGTTLIATLLGTSAAYSIARFRTGGQRLSFTILSLLFLPPVVVAIPMFLVWSQLGLVDTYPALILQNCVFAVPFTIWVLQSFLRDVPVAYEESALVNGASRLRALVDVVLPMAMPSLVATTLLSFIFTWNEFTFAVVLSRARISTLPFILPTMMESHYVLWGDIAGIALIASLPVVVLAFALQRYLVRGLSFGTIRAQL